MSRHLLYCVLFCMCACTCAYLRCNRPMKMAELHWDHKLFTHKLYVLCVSLCISVLPFHAQQCIKPLKSSFFMQNKTTFSLDDESINNSDALL